MNRTVSSLIGFGAGLAVNALSKSKMNQKQWNKAKKRMKKMF
ncbi:DUF3918 family protein [Bacillus coahuilensis]|nr:DUF3918 family protein [Bacillus coahuilensis]